MSPQDPPIFSPEESGGVLDDRGFRPDFSSSAIACAGVEAQASTTTSSAARGPRCSAADEPSATTVWFIGIAVSYPARTVVVLGRADPHERHGACDASACTDQIFHIFGGSP